MKEPKDKRTKEYKDWKLKQPEKVKLGLGDAIANTKNDCGCDKKRMNNQLPVRAKVRRCLTDEQRQLFKDYKTRRTLSKYTDEDKKFLIKLYAHVFALQHTFELLTTKTLFKIDEQLEIVYNESI